MAQGDTKQIDTYNSRSYAGGNVGFTLYPLILMSLVAWIGGKNENLGFFGTQLVFSALTLIGMLILLKISKPFSQEGAQTDEEMPRVSIGQMIKSLVVNKPALTVFIGEMVRCTGYALFNFLFVYQCCNVFNSFSMKPDPIRVHEDVGSYLPTGFQDIQEFGQDPAYPNLFSSYAQVKGDVEKGFAEADVIVENDYSIPFVSHCTMETHQCVVIPEENGDLTIYASEQKGSTAKYEVAGDLGLNPARIHFHIPYLGGGFGGKTSISVTDLAAIAAMKYGCPVRMVMTREESFTSGGLRGAADLHIKDGYTKDGTLVARQMEALCNGGAYSTHSAILVMPVYLRNTWLK